MKNKAQITNLFAIFLILFSSLSFASDGPNKCVIALEGKSYTASSYISEGRKSDKEADQKTPKYRLLDMSKESKAVVGVAEAPKALQKFTGESLNYLSMTSINTDDGYSIKYNTPPVGSSAYRFKTKWAPKGSLLEKVITGTNIFLTNPKWAKESPGEYAIDGPVVLIHMHGFGTPTAEGATGLSIAESLYAHNVPVITLDLPYHAMGPRFAYLNAKEFADWVLNGLAPKLIHPNTKIIFSGHSGGGQLALAMHQISHLPMFDRVLTFVGMSPPADATFGGDLIERMAAQKKSWDTVDEWGHLGSKEDVEFVTNMVKSGKVALSPQFGTELFGMSYSWDMSFLENKDKLKRAVVFMGDADALVYVADKVPQDKYNNAITAEGDYILIGDRKTFDSESKKTGHNIFDALMTTEEKLAAGVNPEKDIKLVYHRLAEVIYESANLGKVAYKDKGQVEPTAYSLMDRVNSLYSHHLSFRPFVKDYVFVTKVTRGFGELNARMTALNGYMKAYNKAFKANKKDEALTLAQLKANGIALPEGVANLAEAQAEMSQIQSIMRGIHISEKLEPAQKARLEENLKEQNELQKQIQVLKKEKGPLEKQLAEKIKAKTPLIQKINRAMERPKLPTEELQRLETELDDVHLEKWIEANDRFTQAAKDHLYSLADANGNLLPENRSKVLELPQAILDVIPEFAQARFNFETAYKELVEAKYQAALAGAYDLPGANVSELLIQLIGQTASIATAAPGSLVADITKLEAQIDVIQGQVNRLLRDQEQLQAEFYSAESPYYAAFELKMAEFLEKPYEEVIRLIEDPEKGQYYRKALIAMLAKWNDLMAPEREKITAPDLLEKDKLKVQKLDLEALK